MVLKQLQSVHSMACQERWYDNLAACVLGLKRKQARVAAEESPEQELVEALEQKYDALKDKLLTEALMKQMGDAEWAALSERERQAKLLKLKLQERKLRQEGKLDEASRSVINRRLHAYRRYIPLSTCFPAPATGYMLRGYDRIHVFPRLSQASCFLALTKDYLFPRFHNELCGLLRL